jgi:hypothetical protein
MPTKFQLLPKDITERLKELSEKVASVEGLVALWLFGSFARGNGAPLNSPCYRGDRNGCLLRNDFGAQCAHRQ